MAGAGGQAGVVMEQLLQFLHMLPPVGGGWWQHLDTCLGTLVLLLIIHNPGTGWCGLYALCALHSMHYMHCTVCTAQYL